jgi:hypothetical protein
MLGPEGHGASAPPVAGVPNLDVEFIVTKIS